MKRKSLIAIIILFIIGLLGIELLIRFVRPQSPEITQELFKKIEANPNLLSEFGEIRKSEFTFERVNNIEVDTVDFVGYFLGSKAKFSFEGKTKLKDGEWVLVNYIMKKDSIFKD